MAFSNCFTCICAILNYNKNPAMRFSTLLIDLLNLIEYIVVGLLLIMISS